MSSFIPQKLKKEPSQTIIAYNKIKQLIVNNQLKPGVTVSQADLTKLIGIGRTPIREAIQKLQENGLCRIIPKQGILITPLSLEDIMEIFEFRVLLEEFTARRAAQIATTEQINQVKEIHVKIIEALEQEDIIKMFDLDRKFHNAIDKICNNKKIIQTLANLRDQSDVRRMQIIATNIPGRLQKSIKEHDDLIKAIQTKDVALAQQLASEHIRGFLTTIVDNLKY